MLFPLLTSGGNMTEAIVDIRDCDFTGLDLSGKVEGFRRMGQLEDMLLLPAALGGVQAHQRATRSGGMFFL